MSQPTPVPDAIDEASANLWRHQDLESITAGAELFRQDESFAITDLTDDEWAAFERALHE
jgi:hypothetical protein